MKDRRLIFASAFSRALATGMLGVLLGIYLARLRFSGGQIGLVVSLGLAGAAAAALLATLAADRWGRKRFLIGLSLAGALAAFAALFLPQFAWVSILAFVGMFNGMGRDRGAGLIIEQAVLPLTVSDKERTFVFARYNVLQDLGHAFGSVLAGLPLLLRHVFSVGEIGSLKMALGVYAFLTLLPTLFYAALSPEVEAREAREKAPLSPESRGILIRLSSLFALDSLAGGFLTTALVSLFFFERFGVGEAVIGALFFGARILNALSHFGAAWLAKKIGLVNTMVFTHIPSSLFLASVPFAPNFAVAALLFLLREGLVEMDVPTRQSYVMAVVKPEERTRVSGVTHLTRLSAWAVAPSFAGLFMQGVSQAMPLYLGAGMKILYDVLLYRAFRHLKPPEEKDAVKLSHDA